MFDDANFSITMRSTEFQNSEDSISYAVQPVGNGLLFFANNRLVRQPISTDICLTGVHLDDKDIGAFGICKWKVNSTYTCTNALNNIVTLDLNDTVYPAVAASTYESSTICPNNCAVCDILSEVCQTPAANKFNYGYWHYTSVYLFL